MLCLWWSYWSLGWYENSIGQSHGLDVSRDPIDVSLWCVVCQKQASRAGTSNYIPQYLWDVITCPCAWYMLLAQHSWFDCLQPSLLQNSSLPSPQSSRPSHTWLPLTHAWFAHRKEVELHSATGDTGRNKHKWINKWELLARTSSIS